MAEPALATDAAIVLGLASTAMPFARSREAEAERWLRILRLHGEAGVVLSGLGVSEAPLEPPAEHASRSEPVGGDKRDAVVSVSHHAVRAAGQRGANTVATTDVLLAVMHVYGADFDRVLEQHGTDHDELVERLGAEMPRSPEA
jgi:hypothetical protein